MNNPLAGTDPVVMWLAQRRMSAAKTKAQAESFSGGIVRNYIQVYRPAVNNGKAKSSSAKKTPDTSDVGSQQQVGGTNQKNGGALQARIKADAHNSIVRGGEDLGVEMDMGRMLIMEVLMLSGEIFHSMKMGISVVLKFCVITHASERRLNLVK